MFRRLRIAFLLYALVFVTTAQLLTSQRSKDWDAPLWIDVYVVAGDRSTATRAYIETLAPTEFDGTGSFLADEAERYGVPLTEPFRLRIVGTYPHELPKIGANRGVFETMLWSLKMRWLATRLRWQHEGPSGDILVFAVFHEPEEAVALDDSLALEKGMIAVANLFASAQARGTNQMIVAHELLHTLGATDKYTPGSNTPIFPEGYAAPSARPLLPQSKAELMAGRIPVDEHQAVIPKDLRQVTIGLATSREIGWTRN